LHQKSAYPAIGLRASGGNCNPDSNLQNTKDMALMA
jgi:hypothetical protein